MTMQAVTLRRKQEKRKSRTNAQRKRGLKKQGRDNRRYTANMAKKTLRTGGPLADWEMELIGWVAPGTLNARITDMIMDEINTWVPKPVTYWARSVTGRSDAKFHKVEKFSDGTVNPNPTCFAATNAILNLSDLNTDPMVANRCLRCTDTDL